MGKIIVYMKEYLWVIGIIVVVGGLIFILFIGFGGGGGESLDGLLIFKMSDVEIVVNV